jgi:hypothetical protein
MCAKASTAIIKGELELKYLQNKRKTLAAFNARLEVLGNKRHMCWRIVDAWPATKTFSRCSLWVRSFLLCCECRARGRLGERGFRELECGLKWGFLILFLVDLETSWMFVVPSELSLGPNGQILNCRDLLKKPMAFLYVLRFLNWFENCLNLYSFKNRLWKCFWRLMEPYKWSSVKDLMQFL